MKIYIVGHKSPDLDSIVSAIQYAEFLKKTKKYDAKDIIYAKAGDLNKETKFILDKFGFNAPKNLNEYKINPDDRFILVDHNEPSQRHEKIDSEKILEVIDHHKINLTLTQPIEVNIKPLGSTSTVMYETYKEKGTTIPKNILGLILSGILSDTVGLKSSTTTKEDRGIAKKISKKLDIKIDKLSFEMFKTKSDTSGLSLLEITTKDVKTYEFGSKKVFINQIETVEPDKITTKKDKLVKTLSDLKKKENYDFGFIVVTDILKVNSQIIYTNSDEKNIIEKAFNTRGEGNLANIGSKMSRKKDISPEIEKIIIND